MKKIKMSGADIKADNGSGRSLSQAYPKRRFHNETIYIVNYNGVTLDDSTVCGIERSPKGWN